ncbi:type II toxin-antitoxin system VapC family toxin [Desulfonatronum sp. SC1]|uniref:type II toxin-antitoxin system VapC family toxin n=1 Tax=Desulfonatronum sp. SC1 TaxID=2109626 RepID=UPI000D31654D|nr:type II toxin-antitoxin system VapC family toxin [Desulfonatronum sp. SC1]PTN34924.1 PIN domain nuclease [Desulfonatronum sp. SC1]
MKLLLDTHILLWAAGNPEKLSEKARAILLEPSNSLFFSAASIWEVVIKQGLGRDDFKVDAQRLRKMLILNRYSELSITSEHVLRVHALPTLHKDPFDRLLIAQSLSEGMLLLTVDEAVIAYQGGVLAV